jgi:hypothetical protein
MVYRVANLSKVGNPVQSPLPRFGSSRNGIANPGAAFLTKAFPSLKFLISEIVEKPYSAKSFQLQPKAGPFARKRNQPRDPQQRISPETQHHIFDVSLINEAQFFKLRIRKPAPFQPLFCSLGTNVKFSEEHSIRVPRIRQNEWLILIRHLIQLERLYFQNVTQRWGRGGFHICDLSDKKRADKEKKITKTKKK